MWRGSIVRKNVVILVTIFIMSHGNLTLIVPGGAISLRSRGVVGNF